MNIDSKPYREIWVSDFFHSFPHVNKHLSQISSKFEPNDAGYRESLAFWALVPVACCILLWLCFFIYFICRCCQGHGKQKKIPSLCPRVTTGLCIFFALGLVSFGLYENEEAHRGVDTFKTNLVEMNQTVGSAVDRIDSLNLMVEDVNDRLANAVLHAMEKISNATVEKEIEGLVRKIQTQATSAKAQVDRIDLTDEFDIVDDTISISHDVEYYRWLGSLVVLCLHIFIFFLTIVGLLIRSRSLLIVSTTICVMCLIFLWAFTGVHLGTSVGVGDFCKDPNSFVINLANNPAERAVLEAYVECKNNTEPYGDEIQTAIKSLNQALGVFDKITNTLKPFHIKELEEPLGEMKAELQYSSNNLSILLDNVGICNTLHGYYTQCLQGACVQTIEATAWMTLTGCLVGLCCVVIILSNSMLWRQYAKRRYPVNQGQVDDTDPFLPRPPPYESDYGAVGYSSPTPWSERGTLQQNNNRIESPYSDESLMMLPPQSGQRHSAPLPVDESPPPAYHPGRFVRQYAASSGR